MTTFGPHVPSYGPCPARIAIVAEAPGTEESRHGRPLVGPSGYELRKMLAQIGVSLDDCFKTNVFSVQPPDNLVGHFGVPKEHPSARTDLPALTRNPMLYIHADWIGELDRLYEELKACRPNIIIALGNIACWALLGQQGISELRGNLTVTHCLSPATKVLPTYHPAAVLRQWEWRSIVLADLEKAHAEADSPILTYDNTELWLRPTIRDLFEFGDRYMRNSQLVATDVETKRGQITCMSFAPDPNHSIIIPFWIEGPDPNYWSTPADEAAAWRWCAQYIEDATLPKVTQNGLYDIQYFIRHKLRPRAFMEDSMLAHHSLLSEMRKGLGFLGSIYTNTQGWKTMRSFKREELLKRDD